jgi:hypothetical protein
MNKMNSDAMQDMFVMNLIQGSEQGYFLDIGSHNPILSNNSYALEKLGWSGICIELEDRFNNEYASKRTAKLINGDATNLNYEAVFAEANFPTQIDYLSSGEFWADHRPQTTFPWSNIRHSHVGMAFSNHFFRFCAHCGLIVVGGTKPDAAGPILEIDLA